MRLWEYLSSEERQALRLLYGGDAEAVLEQDHRLYCVLRDGVIFRLYRRTVPREGIQRSLDRLGEAFCTSPNNVRNIVRRQESLESKREARKSA